MSAASTYASTLRATGFCNELSVGGTDAHSVISPNSLQLDSPHEAMVTLPNHLNLLLSAKISERLRIHRTQSPATAQPVQRCFILSGLHEPRHTRSAIEVGQQGTLTPGAALTTTSRTHDHARRR
ncbi:hypothetical protein PPTG_24151 [Phytophthora nicotianae INRA-310]|uniref:Uncharacterized protein n=1 Tax=Phytophthora nicotianae (strain INRA-310) TaxID=761204 RepID=W2PJA6_PHYN3|nr:hypothetical protein PPTG_24151 [Phytophthora nicotianae INRA-310]ETN00942.1 hypothetical protein PPTG_24151 [Phytophthora nicotianae INRA-310]